MSTFAWVMLGIAVFIGGQWMMMRPGARDQALMHLRESARKKGLQPRLMVPPEWLPGPDRRMVACYTLIVPQAAMPYWRAHFENGQWRTVTPGLDRLAGVTLPACADQLLAMEGQANAIAFYWRETAGEAALDELKQLLQHLAASK